MFVELMPLLAGRTVLITVAKVDDKTIRVNVIPTQAKTDENPALTTPLTYTGPPEELDAELGTHLAGYVQTHTQTASTLAEAKATMEAAAKAAQEQAKRKAEERKKVTQKPPTLATTAEPASSTSSTPGEPVPSLASAGTLGLFLPTTPEPAPALCSESCWQLATGPHGMARDSGRVSPESHRPGIPSLSRVTVRCPSRSFQSGVFEEKRGLAENSTRLRPASFAR
jgi:PRTRC genetic system protein E